MNTHIIKVLDRGTEVMCMAIRMEPMSTEERELCDKNGWGLNPEKDYLFLARMTPHVQLQYDPYEWDGGRTLYLAHRYLKDVFSLKGWESILSIHVVDVRELEGEAP
jgi:hypothetical protein